MMIVCWFAWLCSRFTWLMENNQNKRDDETEQQQKSWDIIEV